MLFKSLPSSQGMLLRFDYPMADTVLQLIQVRGAVNNVRVVG